MTATATCTVVTTATGTRCGADAVHEFTGTDGTTRFAECAAHTTEHVGAKAKAVGIAVGERVEVRRYGRTYVAEVVEVGARGAVYAEFVYGNGARRRVRV